MRRIQSHKSKQDITREEEEEEVVEEEEEEKAKVARGETPERPC